MDAFTDILPDIYTMILLSMFFLIDITGHDDPIYATVNKTKKKLPSGASKRPSSRRRSQSVDRTGNGNPCATRDFDDSISQIGSVADNDRGFKRYAVTKLVAFMLFTPPAGTYITG